MWMVLASLARPVNVKDVQKRGEAHPVAPILFTLCASAHEVDSSARVALHERDEGEVDKRPDKGVIAGVADEGDRFLTVAPTFLQPSEAPGAACGPGQQHREPAMARRTL